MADATWRAHDRQRQADPSDQDALLRAIAARRRAGMPVPGWMLDRRQHAGGPFRSELPLTLTVHLPDGRRQVAGRTPGVVDVPAHLALIAQPEQPTGEALRELAQSPLAGELTGLGLAPDATDADLALLGAFPALERLDLAGCARITDAGLEQVAALAPGLAWLDLFGLGRVGDAGLRAIGRLGGLGTLKLRHCARVTGAGLAPLAGLPSLSALDLGQCLKIDDGGLAHLAGLPHLTALDLSGCRIGDVGLAHLAALPELTLLNLSRTRVSSQGVAGLGKLASLAQVWLLGCAAVGEKAVRELERALPRCEVVAVVEA